MRAGAAEVVITPPIGIELAGYGPRIDRYSTDIHDHLQAQALVIDNDTVRIALITLDTLGLAASFTERVRRQVAQRTQIAPENVMIAASHSHTSPPLNQTRDWGSPDPLYVDIVVQHLAGAVEAAERKLQPVQVQFGVDKHDDLAWNRTGEPLVDPTVMVMAVETLDGQKVAVLVHYACHPVMLGPKSEISADYPGALRQYLRTKFAGAVVMFANGACGDIDPVSNREIWGKAIFEDVYQAGENLGKAAERAFQNPIRLEQQALSVQHGKLTLHYQVPSLETVRANITEFEALTGGDENGPEKFEEVTSAVPIPRFWLRYWRSVEQHIINGTLTEQETVELQSIQLGDRLVIIAVPAEVYTEQGLQIRALVPDKQVMVICYANDLVGYIPTAKAFASGSYASTLAAAVYDRLPFQPSVAETLVSAVQTLLKSAAP